MFEVGEQHLLEPGVVGLGGPGVNGPQAFGGFREERGNVLGPPLLSTLGNLLGGEDDLAELAFLADDLGIVIGVLRNRGVLGELEQIIHPAGLVKELPIGKPAGEGEFVDGGLLHGHPLHRRVDVTVRWRKEILLDQQVGNGRKQVVADDD